MRTNALVLPLTVATLLGAANLLVGHVAGADADPAEAAPTEVPEGLTLTGGNSLSQGELHGILVEVDAADDGPTVTLTNPGDHARVLEVEAVPTYSSGNGMGRMGPFTTDYAPVTRSIEIGAGESVAWTVELASPSGRLGLVTRGGAPVQRGEQQVVRAGSVRRVEAAVDVAVAEPVAPVEVAPILVDIGDNVPVLVSVMEFESWSVGLSLDAGEGPAVKQLVAAK